MFANLNMLQKGLLLVGVPLLFELVFVVYLVRMLDSAEEAVDRATSARIAVSSANTILKLFYDAGTALVSYKTSKDAALLQQCDIAIKQVPPQLQMLEIALGNQPDGAERFRRASLLCERSIDLLDRSRQRADQSLQPFPYEQALPLSAQTELMSKELMAEMAALVKEYKSGDFSMEAALSSRAQLRQFIMGGTALSVIIAIGLAFAFTNGTVRRLRVLMNNTIHLAKKEPMQPLLTGHDEIATLDKVFHQVNDALAAADKEREAIAQIKQDFLNMITHDLRSPLASVSAGVEVLQAGIYGELTATARESLGLTAASVHYMTRLVDDLLDCERIESGEFPLEKAPQDLYDIADSAVSAITNLVQARNIKVVLGECCVEVMGDATRLQQVIANLLHNAAKYSPNHGTIKVEFAMADEQVEVRVTDEGRGIPSEFQTSIFDRYRQVTATDATVKRGSGLGLYFCKQVVELHGGTIGVTSEPGKGSTFWIRLPVLNEQAG